MQAWRDGRTPAISAGEAATTDLNRVVQREADAITKAGRDAFARGDALLESIQPNNDGGGSSPHRVPMSAGSALAIARAADALNHVGLAKLVLTVPNLFSHPCPPQGVIAAIHVLRRSGPPGREFVTRWFTALPESSPHRRTFRVAALMAPLVARQQQQPQRDATATATSSGWQQALTLLRDGPGWTHEQSAGVGLVVLRVSGQWRRALRWFVAEYYSGGVMEPEQEQHQQQLRSRRRQAEHHEIIAQCGEIREQLRLGGGAAPRQESSSDSVLDRGARQPPRHRGNRNSGGHGDDPSHSREQRQQQRQQQRQGPARGPARSRQRWKETQ
jgi:hypothetical protein